MNLTEALYFLDTNAKVSCPEITAQQARELASLIREMDRTEKRHVREWSELLGERDEWDSRMEALERQVDARTKERDIETERRGEALRKLNEARAEVERLKGLRHHPHTCAECIREKAEGIVDPPDYLDTPSPPAVLAGSLPPLTRIEKHQHWWINGQPCACGAPHPPVSAAPDFDASDYERPGRVKK